jgi:hypothetical protein
VEVVEALGRRVDDYIGRGECRFDGQVSDPGDEANNG